MKLLRGLLILAVVFMLSGIPQVAVSGVATVCRKFNVSKSCHSCSSYFYVNTEEEAERKCQNMGYEDAYYFPGPGAAFAWMRGNCDCKD